MSDPLPRTISRPIQFKNGCAIGISNRWQKGQYCVILTEAGLVGCGIYDVKTAAEFGQAIAIAAVRRRTRSSILRISSMPRSSMPRRRPRSSAFTLA